MKASSKSILRSFKSNWLRFILISSIIMVSLILSSGLGSTPSTIKKSYFQTLKSNDISDVIIKSTNESGFTSKELEILANENNFPNINVYTTFDLINDENDPESNYTRYYFYNFEELDENGVMKFDNNKLTLKEGRLPENGNEVIVEQGGGSRKRWNLGDTISCQINNFSLNFEIVGFVNNPLYSSTLQEPSIVDTESLVDTICYFDTKFAIGEIKITIGSIEIAIINQVLPKNEASLELFFGFYNLTSNKYIDSVKEKINFIRKTYLMESNDVAYLTLQENVGVASFKTYINKIIIISFIFPLLFILICSLVCSISFSKYVKDERNYIACNVSLGISEKQISKKYYIFAIMSVLIGGISGLIIGLLLIPYVIFPAFTVMFFINELLYSFDILIGILSLSFILIIAILIIYMILKANFKEKPAELLTNPAPKPGKKILLERMSFIWKRLSFKVKSSIRNVFRYKKNSILILVSNLGSSLLLFLGFGLLDNSYEMNNDPIFNNISEPMKIIALVITIISVLLSSLISFNLINMNVSQRQREIATLKVLGYKDIECSLYTFREIFSIAVIGSFLGVPTGYLILDFVLKWLEFGSSSYINWYSYLFPTLIVIILTIFVNFLIYPRISKIDMNESLKTID